MNSTPLVTEGLSPCWFCGDAMRATCECGRNYCEGHSYNRRCLICALGFGLFEDAGEEEPISSLLMLSLSAAADDPYIAIPAHWQKVRPLPLMGVERVVSAVVKMLGSEDPETRRRAVAVLATT